MKHGTPSPLDLCCPSLLDLIPAAFFKALCDPNRLLLIHQLLGVPPPGRSLSDLAQHLHVDLSVTSRHCAVLRSAGIITATQVGRETRFVLAADRVAGILRNLAELIEPRKP
jgi:DNA-binding transcriptional ArsR family regulator